MPSIFQDYTQMSDDNRLIAMAVAVANTQTDDATTQALIETIKNKPLRRWRFLRQIRAELIAEGLIVEGQAWDWEAIGDFFVKIAPIIFEIIKMFL